MDKDLYRQHLNRIANTGEARKLMQLVAVAVDAYADYFASFGVNTIIELRRPTAPSDNPNAVTLFADWDTARHRLGVSVDYVDDLDEATFLEKLDDDKAG